MLSVAIWIAGLSLWLGFVLTMWGRPSRVLGVPGFVPCSNAFLDFQTGRDCILCNGLFFGVGHGCKWLVQKQAFGHAFFGFCPAASRTVAGGCCSSPFRRGFWHWTFLLFLLGARVGEASHPGPTRPCGTSWTLGIANPSGLNGKLDQVTHLSGEAWILTETQLSQKGVSSFVKGLRMLKSPWKYAIAGAPCPARSSNDTGSHSGVMFLSRFPARALPHDFDPGVYDSARIQVVGVSVADTWVTVGLLYGLPANSQHKHARFQTDALLSDLVDRVACQASGPRAIGGDFNFGPDELDQLARLHSMGFREVQDLRAWRHGQSVVATGRGSKRIDQLWISPELQHAYLGTTVDFACWADHAAVSATFQHDALAVRVAAWPQPQQFPWPDEWTCSVRVPWVENPTVAYQQFWSQVSGALLASPSAGPGCQGPNGKGEGFGSSLSC